ncbi:MAG: TlpA family protein disulfide reductase [Sphingomicrobium sp.]
MRTSFLIAGLLALAACQQKPAENETANEATATAEEGGLKGVHRDNKGKAAPDATFNDPDGKPVKLAAFKGKPLLVNLWATWCAPCVKELPTLDKLAKASGVQVLAVSQDSGPHPSVVAFLQSHQISTLEPYQDANMSLSGALGPDTVLPTTILFGPDGREVWRYIGDLDWTSPEAAKLLSEAGVARTGG